MKSTILAALLLALAGLNASAGVIALAPSSSTPFVGDTFTIDLVVTSNTDEINGFGLNYSTSTAAIGLVSADIDSFFGGDLGLGNPQLAAITFPGATAASVHLVAFSFTANTAGSAVFRVTSDLQDPNQGLFILNADSIDLSRQVTINVQATATPEPATFDTAAGLAMAGLLFVVLRRRAA